MKINDKFGTKKMKYLVDRNKQAGIASNLEEIERNQLIAMKLTKFWVDATSLPFKMSKKRGVCRRKAI